MSGNVITLIAAISVIALNKHPQKPKNEFWHFLTAESARTV